jgi:hypothetical protein
MKEQTYSNTNPSLSTDEDQENQKHPRDSLIAMVQQERSPDRPGRRRLPLAPIKTQSKHTHPGSDLVEDYQHARCSIFHRKLCDFCGHPLRIDIRVERGRFVDARVKEWARARGRVTIGPIQCTNRHQHWLDVFSLIRNPCRAHSGRD